MKKIFNLIVLLFMGVTSFSQTAGTLKLYVGTFTSEGAEGIYLCNYNTETGEITLDKTFKAIDNPNYLKISPDKEFMYVVGRPSDAIDENGFVSAYKIQKDGSLSFLNKQTSHGSDPCYVSVSSDGKYVAVANYGSGSVALYPVNNDGSLMPATSVIQDEGSGKDLSRQSEPHAHSIKFSPFSDQLFSADLGTDRLNIFDLDEGKLVPAEQPFVKLPGGSGPRHFEFYNDGETIFVINELSSTITVLKQQNKKWEVAENISTLPKEFKGESYCADIHISDDGRFVYGSNRGDNSIAQFVIVANTRKLISMGTVEVHGNWPRNFTFSPDGKFMLVANQRSGNITVFKINEDAGVPEFTGKEIKLPSPVCLEFF